jgi:hypothetical protein
MKALKEKKNNQRGSFGYQDFLIFRNFGSYSMVKDVGS